MADAEKRANFSLLSGGPFRDWERRTEGDDAIKKPALVGQMTGHKHKMEFLFPGSNDQAILALSNIDRILLLSIARRGLRRFGALLKIGRIKRDLS